MVLASTRCGEGHTNFVPSAWLYVCVGLDVEDESWVHAVSIRSVLVFQVTAWKHGLHASVSSILTARYVENDDASSRPTCCAVRMATLLCLRGSSMVKNAKRTQSARTRRHLFVPYIVKFAAEWNVVETFFA